MSSPLESTNIHKSLEFLAHFDEHFAANEPAAELMAEFSGEAPKVPLTTLLDRHISVINAAIEDAEDVPDHAVQLTAEEVDAADTMVLQVKGGPLPSYAADIHSMLGTAHEVLAVAREKLVPKEQKEEEVGLLQRSLNKIYTQGMDLSASVVGLVDANRANALHAYAGIERLLGSHRYLNKEMGTYFYQKMLEDPELCSDIFEFVTITEKVYAHHMRLLRDEDICFLSPNSKECGEVFEAHSKIYAKLLPHTQGHPFLNGLLLDLRETFMPCNWQILTDTPRINLLDLEVNLKDLDPDNMEQYINNFFQQLDPNISADAKRDTMYRRSLGQRYVVPAIDTTKKINEYLTKCKNSDVDPDPKIVAQIQKQNGYRERLTVNLLEKVNWEDRHYNQHGGLKLAVRMVGFMTESGRMKEARIRLDFAPLGEDVVQSLTQQQSIDMLKVIDDIHENIDYLAPLLNAVHQNPDKSPFQVMSYEELARIVGDSVIGDENKKKKALKELNDAFNRIGTKISQMTWLNASQRDTFMRIACEYVYNLHREFTIAFMTVGHSAPF